MKTSRSSRSLALLVALALVSAACGGRSDDSSSPGGDGAGTPGKPTSAPGFDGRTIRLGVLSPSSGLVSIIAAPATAGNKAYFDWLNEEKGGIAGRYPVELVIEDTAYDSTIALQKYQAIKDDIALIVQVLGTQITRALLPELEADGIVAGPASLDSAWVREPNLLPVGGPYQIQVINGLDWYFTQPDNDGKKLCTLTSDDEYGDTGTEGTDFAAEQLDVEVEARASFPAPGPGRPAQTFDSQVSQLKEAGCGVIVFIGIAVDTGALATKLSETPGFAPDLIGPSPTWLGLFSSNAYLQEHFVHVSEGPEYGDPSAPGTAQLIDVQETYAPDQAPDVYFNFGYVEASVATQILEKAVELGDLSREGIMRATEEVGTLTFGGLFGEYVYGPPEDREPPRATTIFRVDADKPFGLAAVESNYQAPFADEFPIEEG